MSHNTVIVTIITVLGHPHVTGRGSGTPWIDATQLPIIPQEMK